MPRKNYLQKLIDDESNVVEFARKAGVHRATVYAWLNREIEMKFTTAERIVSTDREICRLIRCTVRG